MLSIFFKGLIASLSNHNSHSETMFMQVWAAVVKSDEHSAPDRRVRIRGLPGETLLCTLMAPGACKICRECNVLQVTSLFIPLELPKRGSHPLVG